MTSIREINTKRDIGVTFFTRLLLLGMKLGVGIITARLLGLEGKGLFILAFYLPGLLASLLSLSIGQSLIYKLRRGHLRTNDLFYAVLVPTLSISAFVIVIYYVAIPMLSRTILDGLDTDLAKLTILVFPWALLDIYVFNVFRAVGRISLANAFSIVRQVLAISILAGSLLLIGRSVQVAVLAQFTVQILFGLTLLVLLLHFSFPPLFSLSRAKFLDIARLGARYHAASILTQLEYRFDILLLAAFLAPGAIALYAVAVTIAQLPWVLSNSVGYVLFPKVASLGDKESVQYTSVLTRHTFLFSALIVVGLAIVFRPLVGATYGNAFVPAYKAFVLLAPGIVINILFRTLAPYFSGVGQPQQTAKVSLITLACNIALNLVLIPRYGIQGAALASLITYTFGGLAMLYLFTRSTGVSWRRVVLFQSEDIDRVRSQLTRLRNPRTIHNRS